MPNKREAKAREIKSEFYTTSTMKEAERVRWRERAKRGEAFEMKGAFGDTVYLPKVKSDVNPGKARRENELRKRGLKRYIETQKERRHERA